MFKFSLASALVFFVSASYGVESSIKTYSYPDLICKSNYGENTRSKLYNVKITQDNTNSTAYVMFNKNQEVKGNLAANPNNHWTNFSYSGNVEIEIERLDGQAINEINVYPLKKGYTAKIQNNKAHIKLTSSSAPVQLFVKMNGMEKEALLIFADPLETDVPNRKDKKNVVINTTDGIEVVRNKLSSSASTIIFSEGVHRWGAETGKLYSGYKLPLESNKKIYIPGGAYVVGSFYGKGLENTKVYGRGVISACGLDRIANTEGIPFTLINAEGGGKNQTVEGLVMLDAPHFNILLRGKSSLVDNVKMMSWWHQTDGITLGENSVGKNSFYKVNDDNIKLYANNGYYENNTFFHQINGAPYQLSWGGVTQNGDNNKIVNSYIVESVYKNIKGTTNTAIINSRKGNKNSSVNNTWDGIYIDNGCHRILGLDGEGKKGSFKDFTIKNIELKTLDTKLPQASWSYLLNGHFDNIRIENLRINGKKITGISSESDLIKKGQFWFQGSTQALILK